MRRHGRVVAAIGRWRHDGARIGLGDVAASRLIFCLSGGQALQWHGGSDVAGAVARCGSVAVAHQTGATLEIRGRGDTLQLLVDPLWLATSASVDDDRTDAKGAMRRLSISARALVALTRGSDADIEAIVEAAAPLMGERRETPARRARRGLAPAALARIESLVERRLEDEPDDLPSVRDLADAAGLSLFHFIRTFEASEGLTPHRWIVARRLDRAVALLLEGRSSVTDVAILAGHPSAAHFVDAFRRTLGVTPGQVRSASIA